MSKFPVLDLASIKVACQQCSVARLCLPAGLDAEEMPLLDQASLVRRTLRRGEALFADGDTFAAVYAVRSGCIKTVLVDASGAEHIANFHLPGELVGLEAFKEDRHLCHAIAVDTTHICALPIAQLHALAQRLPSLNQHLFRLLGQELSQDQEMLLWLSAKSAPERLASFLLGFSTRMRRRGLSDRQFILPMSRHELANHLGLTPETISRTFGQLQKDQLIRLVGKEIELLDLIQLRQLQGSECAPKHHCKSA